MPKFEVNLSDELVEGIKEMVIRENFPVDPSNIPGFIEWLMDNNIESRSKQKQMERIGSLKAKELKEALDDWEKKPKSPK